MASTLLQSEMSAGEIVLGLLIEQPDSCYQLDKRIAERLGSAMYSRGCSSRAMGRLLAQDWVRISPDQRPRDHKGLHAVDARERTIYESTPAGVAHHDDWRVSPLQSPPVREELQAKIALCKSEKDLPRLLEIVREAEVASTLQLDEVNRRARAEREISDASEWEQTIQMLLATGETMWWGARIKWLQDMRLFLEKWLQHGGPSGSSGRRAPAR
jgi:DNA-binding PadR family transcriptional regulator